MSAASSDHDYDLLRKILEEEQKLGYKDTAVIGGIDRFVEEWARSYRGIRTSSSADVDTIESVLQNYHLSSARKRRFRVISALKALRGESVTPVSPSISVSPNIPSHGFKKTMITDPVRESREEIHINQDDHSPTRRETDKQLWPWVGVVGVFALAFLRSRQPNMPPKDPMVLGFQIALSLGLIYFIYRQSTDLYQSNPGEKVWLYHGGIVSARWKEKNDRQGCLIWLWIILVFTVASLVLD